MAGSGVLTSMTVTTYSLLFLTPRQQQLVWRTTIAYHLPTSSTVMLFNVSTTTTTNKQVVQVSERTRKQSILLVKKTKEKDITNDEI
jgi:esterase/lipase superfamily enzyme